MRTMVAAVLAAMLGLACQTAETPEQMAMRMDQEKAAVMQTLVGVEQRYEAFTAAGQGDSIASLFTENGREMPPNAPAAIGRAAIAAFEAQSAATYRGTLDIMSEDLTVNGPLAVERGGYTFSGKKQPGAPRNLPAAVNEEGKYLAHWHKVNGAWFLADLIWNSNKPPM